MIVYMASILYFILFRVTCIRKEIVIAPLLHYFSLKNTELDPNFVTHYQDHLS